MTSDVQGSASSAMTGEVAGEPALVATFYGPSGDERIDWLYRSIEQSFPGPPETRLERFKPPGGAARDTVAIQMALNVPGEEAAKGWKEARQKLEGILSKSITAMATQLALNGSKNAGKTREEMQHWLENICWDAMALKGIWGHTLIYQAELNEGVDPDSALEELLPAIRRLHSSEHLDSLAEIEVSNGKLWLLGIPDRGDGLDAATIYVALSSAEEAKALRDVFYGPNAMLLEPDLISHKGYYQMRQYRGEDLEDRYEESADSLRQTTGELLKGLSQHPAKTDKLDELADKYRLLFPVVAHLDQLHTALVKQKHNYERSSETRTVGGEIVEFHRQHLETATLELKLEVEELQHALEAVDKAVSMAQVKVDEAQERRQLGIEAVLAAAAVGLALPHLLEPETISAFLEWPIGHEVLHMENGLLTGIGHLIVLGVQLAVILPVAFLTYLGVKGSLHKSSGLSKRARL